MMKAKAGRIVFLSSVVGEMGNVGQTAYAASKAAVLGAAKSIASVELSLRHSRLRVGVEGKRIVTTLRLATKKPWAIDVQYFMPARRPLYLTGMAVSVAQQGQGLGRAACLPNGGARVRQQGGAEPTTTWIDWRSGLELISCCQNDRAQSHRPHVAGEQFTCVATMPSSCQIAVAAEHDWC
jgi:hypothetical protein